MSLLSGTKITSTEMWSFTFYVFISCCIWGKNEVAQPFRHLKSISRILKTSFAFHYYYYIFERNRYRKKGKVFHRYLSFRVFYLKKKMDIVLQCGTPRINIIAKVSMHHHHPSSRWRKNKSSRLTSLFLLFFF